MVNIINKKYYFFALSALIIIGGIIGYIVHGGFTLGIQFQGGTIIEVQSVGDIDTAKVEETLSNKINKQVTAQKSSTINSKESGGKIDLLVVSVASKDTLTASEQTQVIETLRSDFGIKSDAQMTVRNVDPSIGKQLLRKGLSAVTWACILIIIYIWWRFKMMSGLSAGVMAIVGLLHDAAIMLSVYTIFAISLNESFIAAVLTILGYSMNDTIIIYDRIRENSHELRRVPIAELVNKSILQTLTRSINTVATVLISIITVYLFAVYNNIPSIEEFAFPLIIGIASGCYSSIFITCPLWVMWKERQDRKNNKNKGPIRKTANAH